MTAADHSVDLVVNTLMRSELTTASALMWPPGTATASSVSFI